MPDAEFQQALPPLSSDPNAPLEAMPTIPDASGPAIAVPDTELPAPSAPAPELAQPLQPLNTFDTTPPAQFAAVKDADAPKIAYTTELKGLSAIGLESQFESLSALKDGKGKAANATQVRARAKEDEALAVRLMKSLGYYDGTAISTIAQEPGQPGRVKATVSATPGKQYKLGTITVTADPTVPPNLVRDNLPLKTGDAIDAAVSG